MKAIEENPSIAFYSVKSVALILPLVKFPALKGGVSHSISKLFPPPRWGRIKVGVMPFFSPSPNPSHQGRGILAYFRKE